MLYHLLYPLHTQIAVLNVTRYITFRTAAASLTALIIGLFVGPAMIRKLREFQIGQVIRQDGPATHRTKAGTPTMGGLLILTSALVPTLLWADLTDPFIWIAVLSTVAFGAIGFADDYLKIVRKSHHGLRPRYKMAWQIVAALGVGVALQWMATYEPSLYSTRLIFPFFKRVIPGSRLVVRALLRSSFLVGATNEVNLTDGLDGLAISVFAVSAAAFTALAYVSTHVVFSNYLQLVRLPPLAAELTIFCGALVGASLGFLWWNCYPAEIFMGDVGSLGLGGALGTVALLIKQEILLRGRRRRLRDGGGVGHHPGRVVQDDGPARVQDGAAPSPLRADRLERTEGDHAVRDRRDHLRAVQPDDVEAAMTGDRAFSVRGKRVTVVGAARSGIAAAELLVRRGATRDAHRPARSAGRRGSAARGRRRARARRPQRRDVHRRRPDRDEPGRAVPAADARGGAPRGTCR